MFSAPCSDGMCGWARDTPVGPEERVWREHAVDLGIRFGIELSDDPGCQMLDFIFVSRAAETLWAASPGSPHWRDLDVEAVLALLDRMHMGDLRDNAIASLIAFTYFLSTHGYITANEALVMKSRLDPYAPQLMIAMGYEPVPLPAHLRPS
jgi:hypothetical protein